MEVQELVLNTNQPVLANEPVTLTISSIGDCTLGTDINFAHSTSLNAFYDLYGPDYFFQNVRSVLEADDLTIVNMEGNTDGVQPETEQDLCFQRTCRIFRHPCQRLRGSR